MKAALRYSQFLLSSRVEKETLATGLLTARLRTTSVFVEFSMKNESETPDALVMDVVLRAHCRVAASGECMMREQTSDYTSRIGFAMQALWLFISSYMHTYSDMSILANRLNARHTYYRIFLHTHSYISIVVFSLSVRILSLHSWSYHLCSVAKDSLD